MIERAQLLPMICMSICLFAFSLIAYLALSLFLYVYTHSSRRLNSSIRYIPLYACVSVSCSVFVCRCVRSFLMSRTTEEVCNLPSPEKAQQHVDADARQPNTP